jgi:hypothetical protein
MRNEWNRHKFGIFPILALLVVLFAAAGSFLAITVGNQRPDEVVAAAAGSPRVRWACSRCFT